MACHEAQQLRAHQFQAHRQALAARRRGFLRRRRLDVGDHVRVKYGVVAPWYGWGQICPEHVGTIERILGKTCRVRFASGLWKGTISELELAVNPADAVASVVFGMAEKLFEDKQFADVTFVLADGEERAHRAILAASSEAFAAMFTQPMQEGSGRVHLRDTRAAAIRAFLRLVYTGKTDPADWQPQSPCPSPAAETEEDGAAKPGSSRERRYRPELRAPISLLREVDQDPEEATNEIALADGWRHALAALDSTRDGEDESSVNTDDDEDDSEGEESEGEVSGDGSDARTGSSCNENSAWIDPPTRIEFEMPLPLLLEAADLAHRYRVKGVLSLLVEALRLRMFRYFVELEVCPVTCEQPFWTSLQDIIVFARRNDILELRVAALQMARRSAVVRKAFRAGKLCSEARQEFSANWPLVPPTRSSGAPSVWLS